MVRSTVVLRKPVMSTTAPVHGPGRLIVVCVVGGDAVERLGLAVAAGLDQAVVAEDAVLAGAAEDLVHARCRR